MIEKDHKKLSVRRQCDLLKVNRNRLEARAPRVTEQDELIMRHLDEIYTEMPFYGARKLRQELLRHGLRVGRNRVRRLMRVMGIEALVPQPRTSRPNKDHAIYPYLLRDRVIAEADEVWCATIPYLQSS